MQIVPKDIKNILVLRNDRFGEFLLNIPAFRALRETFLNARIIAVVDPYVNQIAECVPYIDEVIVWARQRHRLLAKLKLIRLLKQKNIDMAIMLNPSKEFNIFTYLAGIPVRAGYNRKWGFLLTHKKEDKKYLGDKHEIEYNLELVGLLGAKTEDKTLTLNINCHNIDTLFQESDLREGNILVALHPFTSDPIKQWPQEYFCTLARRLIQELHIEVVIIGGEDELPRSTAFFSKVDSKLINLTGRTTLKQLAILLKRCRLLITGDSGPMHLASCMGTRVIAIFRSDLPEKSAVRWGPTSPGSVVIQKNNLADIKVEEILDKVKFILLNSR